MSLSSIYSLQHRNKFFLTWILSHRGQNPARRAQLIKSLGDLIKRVGVKPLYLLTSFFANRSDDKKSLMQNLGLSLILLLTLMVFSPVIKAPFLNWGDGPAILAKPIYFLENHFFKHSPAVFHLNNLLLHLVVISLVYVLALQLKMGPVPALLAALIFAIEPAKVEAVAWVSQRKEMLYSIFYLASMIAYLKDRHRLCFLLGLVSLSINLMAASLPLALVLIDGNRFKKIDTGILKGKGLYFLAGGIFLFVSCWSNRKDLVAYITKLPYLLMGYFSPSPFYALKDSLMAVRHFFYLPSVLVCIVVAGFIGQAYAFLRSHEAIIRQLFMLAVVVLVLGLGLLSYSQAKLWQEPLELWKCQIKTAPHPIAYEQWARHLIGQEAYRRAKQQFRAYNDLLAQGAEESKLAFDKGNVLKVNEIIGLYQKAISLNPRYFSASLRLAQLYFDIAQYEQAIDCFDGILKSDPTNKEAMFGLALAYQRINKPKQSIDAFNRLLRAYPDNEDVYVNVVDAYTSAIEEYPQVKDYKQQREDVLSAYEQLSKRKKYSALDYFNLGFLYEQVGGYEEAVRFYKKALEINPSYEKALYNLANRYQEMGDLKTALVLYQKLVHDHPRYALGYLNMGVIYNALGDIKNAKRYYQKTIDVDRNNAGGYFNLGFLSESRGDLKEALNYYEKAVESDPFLAEGYYNMGNVYAALGQAEEAIASYLKTVGINKNHQNAYINLSILSFKSRDFSHAIHYLEEAQLLGYNPPVEYLKSLEPYRKKK